MADTGQHLSPKTDIFQHLPQKDVALNHSVKQGENEGGNIFNIFSLPLHEEGTKSETNTPHIHIRDCVRTHTSPVWAKDVEDVDLTTLLITFTAMHSGPCGKIPPAVRYRHLLKHALRSLGLRAVSVRPAPGGGK